jgi:hypothetical protein
MTRASNSLRKLEKRLRKYDCDEALLDLLPLQDLQIEDQIDKDDALPFRIYYGRKPVTEETEVPQTVTGSSTSRRETRKTRQKTQKLSTTITHTIYAYLFRPSVTDNEGDETGEDESPKPDEADEDQDRSPELSMFDEDDSTDEPSTSDEMEMPAILRQLSRPS